MNENIAYKLTKLIMQESDMSELEYSYKLFGGKLIVAIYNEICEELCENAQAECGCCESSAPMGGNTEKREESYLSKEEIAEIAKDVVNLLAEKNCTIEEADNVLRIVKLSIDNTSTVRKLEY